MSPIHASAPARTSVGRRLGHHPPHLGFLSYVNSQSGDNLMTGYSYRPSPRVWMASLANLDSINEGSDTRASAGGSLFELALVHIAHCFEGRNVLAGLNRVGVVKGLEEQLSLASMVGAER